MVKSFRVLQRPVAVLLLVIVIGYISASKEVGAAGVTSFPSCTTSNQLSAKIDTHSDTTKAFIVLIVIQNNGSVSCSLSGVPSAQAVTGANSTPVGLPARFLTLGPWGVPLGAHLKAHGGKAYVEYAVLNHRDWDSYDCGQTKPTTGAELMLPGTRTFYIHFGHLGDAVVCTKFENTEFGPISSKAY